MTVVISYIKLKTPFHFFKLSHYALLVTLQLKKAPCLAFKKQGYWTHHYTMTLWKNKEDVKKFSTSGAHLKSMKISASIAKEIRTAYVDSDTLPSWKEAKELLEKGKVINYE